MSTGAPRRGVRWGFFGLAAALLVSPLALRGRGAEPRAGSAPAAALLEARAEAGEAVDAPLERALAAAPSVAPGFLGAARPKGEPRRVVTVAPSATELMFALGAGARVVAVSRYDELEAVQRLPRVGGFIDPSLEAIVAERPDLVVAVPNAGAKPILERLAALGVPVLVVPGNSFTDIFHATRALAPVLGGDAPARAKKALEDLEHDAREISRAVAGQSKPRVAFVYGWTPLVLAGPGSFADTMLALLNAKNVVATGPAYTQYAVEKLIEDQPDVIIDASQMSGVSPSESPWARLTTIPAVKANRIYRLRAEDVLVPAPRIVEGMKRLAALLHPKAG